MIAIALFASLASADTTLDRAVSLACQDIATIEGGGYALYNCATSQVYTCEKYDQATGSVTGCKVHEIPAPAVPPPAPVAQPAPQTQYIAPPPTPVGRCENFAGWEGRSTLNSMSDVWGNDCWDERHYRPANPMAWTFVNPESSGKAYAIVFDDDVQVQYRGAQASAVQVTGDPAALRRLGARVDGMGGTWLSVVEPGDVSRTFLGATGGTLKIYELTRLPTGIYTITDSDNYSYSVIGRTQGQYTCLPGRGCE